VLDIFKPLPVCASVACFPGQDLPAPDDGVAIGGSYSRNRALGEPKDHRTVLRLTERIG